VSRVAIHNLASGETIRIVSPRSRHPYDHGPKVTAGLEIIRQLPPFADRGGRVVIPVPTPEVV
jgi:hypothetical protein